MFDVVPVMPRSLHVPHLPVILLNSNAFGHRTSSPSRFSALRAFSAGVPWRGAARASGLALLLAGAAGCERVKERLWPKASDPAWESDSSVLASRPEILFRIGRREGSVRIIPMATIGPSGFRTLSFSNRGWRALDVQYLQRGTSLTSYSGGRPSGPAEMMRGMWDATAGTLDSIPGCPGVVVPVGIPQGVDGKWLLTSGTRPPLKPVKPLSEGEKQEALALVGTLIAPTSGINGAQLGKYSREVHVASTGATSSPSIVVVYDDPETVPDTLTAMGARPRQLVVILDRGLYGYRPSYTYTTLGNSKSPPRIRFLDYLDVNDDGRAEIFMGMQYSNFPFATIVLRYENEVWSEQLKFGGDRCR